MLIEAPGQTPTAKAPGLRQELPRRLTKFSVGIIGAGDIARSAHIPTLKAMPDVDLAWVTDLNATRANTLGKAYKLNSFGLPQKLDRLPEADVVLLAIPYGVRGPYYDVLSQRGTAIYVEKPFARTTDEQLRICSLFPDYALASGLMMRCWATNLLVRDAIAARLFGSLRAVRFAFGRPGLVTQGRYYFDTAQGGGGMVSEVGIHGIDAVLFVTGAVAAEIGDVNVVWDGSLDLHTDAHLKLRLPDGDSAACHITVTGMDNVREGMELEFEHAVLSYPLPGQGFALHGDKVDMNVKVRPAQGRGPGYTLMSADNVLAPMTKFQMFQEYWSRFLGGVRAKKANWTSAMHSSLTTEVMENIGKARV